MRKQLVFIIVLLFVRIGMHAQDKTNHLPGPSPTSSIRDRHYLLTDRVRLGSAEDTIIGLVDLVKEAAALVQNKGEGAFTDFRVPGSRWRQDETYIFVLDPQGNMLVHPDPELEGRNELELKDLNGKPIIRGLLEAATAFPDKPEGWYHYEWPVPGGLQPRWKSSYVRLVKAPSGKSYVVGSGMYNDRMEREFVVDMVTNAVSEVEKNKDEAFRLFHDITSPYRAKDAYIFVLDSNGVELANPGNPNLEGRSILDMKDVQGKLLGREMLKVIQTDGSGWVDYMWPRPGESVSTQKSTYVAKARVGNEWMLVGCGVYLPGAPQAASSTKQMTAPELMALVRDAAAVFEKSGEKAFPEFRQKGFRWLVNDTYFFVFTMDGTRAFHAAEPQTEGRNDFWLKDVQGRPLVKMLIQAASTPKGEGWAHYLWPEPGNIFPTWKSSFVKRVTFPSGKQYIIGSGIYNMQMDKSFIEDVVNRAADLVSKQGRDAFPLLRDKTGPFHFMDTYVFVMTPDGTEQVNGSIPALEGRNLLSLKDPLGNFTVKDEIAAAMKDSIVWMKGYFYKPGQNEPAQKLTYLRKVRHGGETFIVGSGLYLTEEPKKAAAIQKLSWKRVAIEKVNPAMTMQAVQGEKGTLIQVAAWPGLMTGRHAHNSEEYFIALSGSYKFTFDDRELVVNPEEVLVVPPNLPHAVVALKEGKIIGFFAPKREDWILEKVQYMHY